MKPLTRLMAPILLSIASLLWTSSAAAADADSEPTQAELEQVLAPIALYPDSVLSHILIAATYPLEIVQAERWVKANRDLTGESALKAVDNKDWDPSVKALVAFPQIVARMSEDLAWTQSLGDAFLANEEAVLDSIQNLRERAYAAGSLKSLEHVKIEREAETITIEPAVREVVYIPYYDTRVVYGDWHWHGHPPVFWKYSHHFPNSHTGTHFYWSTGVRVKPRYVLSSFHWDKRHVVVVDVRHRNVPYFHTSRHIIHHRDAHRWQHNPHHRRGAHYSRDRLRREYGRNMHPPRRHEPNHIPGPRRVPAGRHPNTIRTNPHTEHTPNYPGSSVTPRRFGRHPGVEAPNIQRIQQPGRPSSGQRLSPGRELQKPRNVQRAHPIRNSPRSSTNNSSRHRSGGSPGRPSAGNRTNSPKPSGHLRSGGTVNRLIRSGP